MGEKLNPTVSNEKDIAIIWGLVAGVIVWFLSDQFLLGALSGAAVGGLRYGSLKRKKPETV